MWDITGNGTGGGQDAIVVGRSSVPDPFRQEAYRATISGGKLATIRSLGTLLGGDYSEAYSVSRNGAVSVGRSNSKENHDLQPVMWAPSGQILPLALSDGVEPVRGEATAVSASGVVVVGRAIVTGECANGLGLNGSFRWTPSSGMRCLDDVIAEHGLDLDGWQLVEPTGVSDDGRTIVGNGYYGGYQQGWVFTVPNLYYAVQGDLNGDADVDLLDFRQFELCFAGLNGRAVEPDCESIDLDHDGDVDLLDFSEFQRAFTGTFVCGNGVVEGLEECDSPDVTRCDENCRTIVGGEMCGPDTGDCFSDNGTPGCELVACCVAVCNELPECCSVAWNFPCNAVALVFCANTAEDR